MEVKETFDTDLQVFTLETEGYRKNPRKDNNLYMPVGEGYEPQTIKLIPYFAFANRGESDMRVWLNKF
ncbi:MAG: hypothetical protein GXZ02_11910 [Clostridiales bacterium]|nr:hypothetical protein [Clostridiales bacterium]